MHVLLCFISEIDPVSETGRRLGGMLTGVSSLMLSLSLSLFVVVCLCEISTKQVVHCPAQPLDTQPSRADSF